MARKKNNATMKQLDAGARLALGPGKSEGQIVVYDGWMYSAGMDMRAEAPQLPNGVYVGKQLIEAFKTKLKHASEIDVAGEVNEETGGWYVVLKSDDETYHLDWRDVEMDPPDTPPATWTVSKDQRTHIKVMYTLAAKLTKKQVRYVELNGSGIMRFVSPVAVMDWWYEENVNHTATGTYAVNVSDLKRAALYRGGKLEKIGESDGKINFLFDDGAWMRVDQYDGPWYHDHDQIGPRFQVDGERVLLGEGAGLALAAMFEKGKRTVFQSEQVPAPVGGVNGPIFTLVADCAREMQFCTLDTDWRENRILLKGANYRAILSVALTEEEAMHAELI